MIIKAPFATATPLPLRIGSVRLFVCLSPKCVHKNTIFSKSKQFRARVSINNL